jgi:hypothetical protein
MNSYEVLEFLNQNSLRAFPVREFCSRVSQDNSFTIPDSFLVDLSFSASGDPSARYFISNITSTGGTISVTLSDATGNVVGSFSVNVSGHTRYQAYSLAPSSLYPAATGWLVVNELSDVLRQGLGTFAFTLNTAEIEFRCATPSQEGIRRIVFQDNLGRQRALSGDVTLVAGRNMRLTWDGGDNSLTFDAGEGLGLNVLCEDTQRPILTINDIPPDEDGNFELEFSGCADVTNLPNGIRINDSCTKSCVNCDELESLTERLIKLENDAIQFRNRYNQLLSDFSTYKALISAGGGDDD